MRMPRFFQSIDASVGDIQPLSATNHRHAVQVLRLKVGDALILFDGNGGEYTAQIHECGKRDSSVRLAAFNEINRESPLFSTLVLATIKPDKMDFAIQKAVELGVSRIQPMLSQRSVIKIKPDRIGKKLQHWEAVIVGACEQSGRTHIPRIEAPLPLQDCLEKYTDDLCIGLLPTATDSFQDLTRPASKAVALFIGPEGGFTQEEEALFTTHAVHTVRFGPRILRAETAVIAGLTACQQQWGDL